VCAPARKIFFEFRELAGLLQPGGVKMQRRKVFDAQEASGLNRQVPARSLHTRTRRKLDQRRPLRAFPQERRALGVFSILPQRPCFPPGGRAVLFACALRVKA
jgi:hypothetical protein